MIGTLLIAVVIGLMVYLKTGNTNFSRLIGNKIAEGVIEYDITYPKINSNNMMLQGLPNKAYLRFKNNNMINDMTGMMGMISVIYISRHSSPQSVTQALTLINKKYAADIPLEEVNKMNSTYIVKVEEGKNKKEVAGYKCKEAIATLNSGEAVQVYYTNQIAINNPNWSNPYYKIDGVLMDFHIERYGLAMHFRAKQVSPAEVDDGLFLLPDDYQKIPFQELDKMLMELNPPASQE